MTTAANPGASPTAVAPATDAFAALRGWRRRGMAILLGILAALALPPVHAVPLLWIALPGLVLMLAPSRHWRAAFGLGWWFGFGHFVAGLYWLAWPLSLDLAKFGWMIPFAVFGISGVMAIFAGLATAVTHATRLRGLARLLVLALAWTAGEWLRGHLFTGFPWNLLGSAWAGLPTMMQPAALVGAYGLGLATIVVAGAPALLFDRSLRRWERGLGLALCLGLLFGWQHWSGERIAGADPRPVEGVRLRLVQGNIEQTLKWVENRREQTFSHYLALTASPGFDRVTHVVWPETAIDYRFVTDYPSVRIDDERRARLAAAVPAGGALITGAIRDQARRWYNSVHVVGPGGTVLATYDKHHLVPFGEYVPLRGLLRSLGVEQLAHGGGDYSAGAGPQTLAVPGAPAASPLICYEAIFPGTAAGPQRPGWIVNVTNDAWFGLTSGPYQHLVAARLRGVEEGLPVVRAANTGITAIADAYGRITARLPIMTTGVLDADLPRAAPATIYARLGDRALLLQMLAVLVLVLALGLRQKVRAATAMR